MTRDDLRQVDLTLSTDYRFKVWTTFEEGEKDLKGLRCYSKFWHSKDRIDPTKFNNWNMTTLEVWDKPDGKSFWYASNTTLLMETAIFVIGKE